MAGTPAVAGAFDKEVVGLDRERYTDGAFRIALLHDLPGLPDAPSADDNGKTTGLAAHLDPDLYHFRSVLPAMPRTCAADPESSPLSIAYGHGFLHHSYQYTKANAPRSMCTHSPTRYGPDRTRAQSGVPRPRLWDSTSLCLPPP